MELISEAIDVCTRYIEQLKKFKPIFDWLESGTKPQDLKAKLSIDKRTDAVRVYWEEYFQRYFTPKQFIPLPNDVKKDSTIAVTWHNDEKQREKDATAIQQKATEIYQNANFINPGMRNILLPSHNITDEILDWLSE